MAWNNSIDAESPAFELVTNDSSAIRALAGPGTGKTFAVRHRVARLISGGVDPRRILVVTFTRTAASDLRREIQDMDVGGSELIWAGTLHSFCAKLLLQDQVADVTGRFARILLEHEITAMLWDADPTRFGRLRDRRDRLTAFESGWARLQSEEPGYAIDDEDGEFASFLNDWLGYFNAMLVGELVPIALSYVRQNPTAPVFDDYDHILVDEYQDLNKAEQTFIHTISREKSVVIVGDDDQSIYGFKHAHPDGIRTVPDTYAPCEQIDFAECRRCPTAVVNLAANLIRRNRKRARGDLLPHSPNPAGRVEVVQWDDMGAEVSGIAEFIAAELETGEIELGDVLVVSPRRRIGYRVRDELLDLGVESRSYFREDALSSDRVRYWFAILQLVAYPNDAVALRYAIGASGSGGRAKQFAKLRDAVPKPTELRSALERCLENRSSIRGIHHLVEAYRVVASDIERVGELVALPPNQHLLTLAEDDDEKVDLWELSQLLDSALNQSDLESTDTTAPGFASVFDLIQSHVAKPDSPSEVNHVRIMSLHASKGLSAKLVVISGAIQAFLPGSDPDPDTLEEQRRLFYVAVTRCRATIGGYPGKLVVSSFRSIWWNEALQLGVPWMGSRGDWTMHASPFVAEMGPGVPNAVRGNSFLRAHDVR